VQLRDTNLKRLDSRVFDVAIIGGGVNGAVSAAALASQGASVALIDRGDFAGETSQSSSNLAWGGIKYLESYEFGLVYKLCRSRNHLMRSYPSTVREIRFFGSIAKGFRRSRIMIFLGTLLYWFMGAFFTRPPRLLSRGMIAKQEPRIKTETVAGGVEYSDAYLQDNDARFVFRFVRRALDHGAVCANYVESHRSIRKDQDGSWLWATEARDLQTGRPLTIHSRVLVNACGPWADEYSNRSGVETRHRHLFSKGVHLVIDRVVEAHRVLAFFADDGRLFFVIPMGPKTVIGTTDTRVESLPATVTDEDRQFILENINKRLKLSRPLTPADIISERCGVRPLAVQGGGVKGVEDDDWTQLSRRHIIETDVEGRRVTIFGGKLTDCINIGSKMAAEVQRLGVELPYRGRRWYGEPPDEVRDEFFHQAALMDLDGMTARESSEPLSTRLWRRYAADALPMLEKIRQDPSQAEVLINGTEYIRAEVEYAARCEMITELEDFLRRRTQIALIERPDAIKNAPGLSEACQILFADDAELKLAAYFAEPDPSSPRSDFAKAPKTSAPSDGAHRPSDAA